jgi:adenosylcobinamide-phosphate synthase
MVALVVGVAGVAAAATARSARPLGAAGVLLEAFALKSTFSVRALLAAGGQVRLQLEAGELGEARRALRSLVSRPVAELTPGLVAAAAIESLAENATDSALAPWLAFAACGLPGAAAYRTLNTLDSMVGYRGRFEYLGKTAARLDDLANLLPARIGALLIALAAGAGAGSPRRAMVIAAREHRRTASPNAGWTMAAIAGALGVRLEKVGAYRLGDGDQPDARGIRRAQRIVLGALALGLGLSCGVAWSMERGARGGADPRRAAPRGRARGRA